MSKKLFVVSDIHGHYSRLMEALESAGFDSENEAHVFVSCGDLFDRGAENVQVYEFVKGLARKILIRGNHEDMLCDILKRGYITANDVYNGMDITVEQMLGAEAVDAKGAFSKTAHAKKIRELKKFVASMSDYYESGDYVFTHGWLPVIFDGKYPHVNPSWKKASKADWEYARFVGWHEMYDIGAVLEGKTIVCGHRPASLGRMFDDNREHDLSEPFYGEGVIAIDAFTVRSGRVNVLVIEE